MKIVQAFCVTATVVSLLSACADTGGELKSQSAQTTAVKKTVVKISSQYDGAALRAHYWVPKANEPMPAAILLHGSGGTGERRGSDDLVWEAIRARANHLNEAGFVTLILDSWSPRGVKRDEGTENEKTKIAMRASDVVDAASYLRNQSSVRPEAIGAVGYSQGAPAALAAVDNRGPSAGLSAIVGWYPSCPVPLGNVKTPTLFLAGEADDWVPIDECRYLDGEKVNPEVRVFNNATHAFDLRFNGTVEYKGYTLRHDADATEQADARTVNFLQKHAPVIEAFLQVK